MFKIGDFSKLAQVSVKTLRHYGKLGLFKPAWIDRFTGYRYYTPGQLPRLNRILALRELNFSLEQIQQLLRSDIGAAELRGMMQLKEAELERQVQIEQARLAQVQVRLRQIEREGSMPAYEVVLKTVSPQRVVGIRDQIPGFHDLAGLFQELRAYLQSQKLVQDMTCLYTAVYYDAEHRDRSVDVEVLAPVTRTIPGTARVIAHDLPGVETMACVVHQGSYEGLSDAYRSLMAWIEINDHRIIGPNRDVYLQGPNSGQETTDYVTELQFPVQKKPVSFFITQHKEIIDMEPKIVTKPAFIVVGMLYRGKNENNEIPQLWQAFNLRAHEIQDMASPGVAYGVCGEMDDSDAFNYLAGFGVTDVQEIPAGMTSWNVPEQTYAVFPCTLKTIHQAYQHAFQTWLPSSGYQRAEGPDFEYYDEEFDLQADDPILTIYIPIK